MNRRSSDTGRGYKLTPATNAKQPGHQDQNDKEPDRRAEYRQERDERGGEQEQGQPLPVEQGILNQLAEAERALAARNLQCKTDKLDYAQREKDYADESACR